MTKKTKKAQSEKFEDLLGRLEEIVDRLEEGELELEESLAAFEEGVGLSKKLNQVLTQAKERVEILMKDSRGGLTAQPFEEDQEGADDVPF